MDKIPKLLIDDREPNVMILLIEKYPEYFPKIEVTRLDVYDELLDEWFQAADYTNEFHAFAVERKVIHTLERDHDGYYKDGDFHTSLMRHQFQDQISKIYYYYDRNRWVLTEGYLINYAVKHPKQANYAYSMVGHCGAMNVGFRECYDKEDFLLNLYWINRESLSEPLERQDVKETMKLPISQLASFARIPGVGEFRAKKIFKTYPTIEEIILHKDELHKIVDIGKKTEEAVILWATEIVEINENI